MIIIVRILTRRLIALFLFSNKLKVKIVLFINSQKEFFQSGNNCSGQLFQTRTFSLMEQSRVHEEYSQKDQMYPISGSDVDIIY